MESGVAPRVLHGVARCSEKLGRISEARRAWERIVREFSSDAKWVAVAQEELQRVSVLTERVRLEGVILDEHGYPVPNAYVLAGTWLFEPPLLTDKEGRFSAERKVRRHSLDDSRYCLVYAEHPYRPVAAAQAIAVGDRSNIKVTIRLKPTTSLHGFVKRSPKTAATEGEGVAPMPRERLFVDGAKVTLHAVSSDEPKVRVPLDLLVPARYTDANGEYVISNLVSGLRYRVHAAKPGYSLEKAGEAVAGDAVNWVSDTIVTEKGMSRISGRVTDPAGSPLRADVSVFTMYPEARWLATTRTTPDGFYRFDALPEDRLIVRARTTGGHGARALAGIDSGRDDVHFVLRSDAAIEVTAKVGATAPEIRATGVNTVAPLLAHGHGRTTVVHFWRRARAVEPPRKLADLVTAYEERGLRVICLHDHSGFPPDLGRLAQRLALPYALAIDDYVPARDPEALNGATMGRYGLEKGDTILIGASTRLLARGSPDQIANLVEKFLPDTEESPGGASQGRDSDESVIGEGAPPLQIDRWIRGEPVNGGPVRLDDLRGRTVILHFSSIYLSASTDPDAVDGRRAIEHMLTLYESRGLSAVWILPSSDDYREGRRFARARPGSIPIGIDSDGETYKSYQVRDLSESCIIDGHGKLLVRGILDNELLRVTKDILGL